MIQDTLPARNSRLIASSRGLTFPGAKAVEQSADVRKFNAYVRRVSPSDDREGNQINLARTIDPKWSNTGRRGEGGWKRERGVWFKSFSVNQRQPGCLLRMAGRVDAIDPGLSRERVVSRRAGGTAGCANRAAVEGESLSALIAVIKFENLPDPSPTEILRLRISNRSWAYSQHCHAPKRIISRHFGELCRRAIVFFFFFF